MSYNLTTMQSIFYGQSEIVEITHNNSKVYQKSGPGPVGPDFSEPLYVQNTTNSAENIVVYRDGTDVDPFDVYYSTDKSTWNLLGNTQNTSARNPLTLSLPANSKIYFRADATGWCVPFATTHLKGTYDTLGGNIMSLLYGANFTGEEINLRRRYDGDVGSTFKYIFADNTVLADASNLLLPAVRNGRDDYEGMFRGCTALVNAPRLRAKFPGGYFRMFHNCTSLESIVIDAEEIQYNSSSNYWKEMFSGCSSLNHIVLTSLHKPNTSNMRNWLNGVAATGTIETAYGSSWTLDSASGIPIGWTKTAPTKQFEITYKTNDNSVVAPYRTFIDGVQVDVVSNTMDENNVGHLVITAGVEGYIPDCLYRGDDGESGNKLTAVYLPAGIKFDGRTGHAFYDCYMVTDFQLPSDLEYITKDCFEEMQRVPVMHVPASTTIICNDWPFYHVGNNSTGGSVNKYCTIYFHSPKKIRVDRKLDDDNKSICISRDDPQRNIYVPSNLVNDYKTDVNFSLASEYIFAMPE